MNTPLVVTAFLDRARSLYGGAVGVACGPHRLTYAEIGARVDRVSSGLHGLGVRGGDVVACLSYNCHRLLELYYAVPQMGAILLPINVRLRPDDVEFILRDSGASVAIVDRSLAGLLGERARHIKTLRHVIFMGGDGSDGVTGTDYEVMLHAAPASYARPAVGEDDVAELFYTSGTTARPKGVMLTQRNLSTHATALMAVLHLGDSDVQLHTIPLFHVNGWGTPHTITCVGGRHVMLPAFDPERVLETVERERVTQMLLVPTMAVALLHAPSARTRDLSSLRRIKLGGAASPPSLVAALDAWLPDCAITAGYGLTETTPVLTVASLKPGFEDDPARSVMLRASAGLPLPGVEIEVLAEDGRSLPHDGVTAGEICARGNTVMLGYWKQPEETERAMAGGWFHTGDVGTIDPDGYVHIVDRKKDIIISGGENISSLEVERAIHEHPAVLECAVIPVPDERWGETPAAIVVLRPGASLTEADLIAFCKTKLAGFKVPHHAAFVAALPKGGTGKILKRELRAAFTA